MALDPRDLSVVVQGPVDVATTAVLASIRRHLPGAEIVLSTWAGTSVDGLECNVAVLNDDPGPLARMVTLRRNGNANRMIVSTRNGLLAATRLYAIKTRTDVQFTSARVLSWSGRYPMRAAPTSAFAERVVVSTFSSTNPRRGIEDRLYHLSDIFQFGRRQDLIDLWSPPLVPESTDPDVGSMPIDLAHYSNEQYIWLSFVTKRLPEVVLQNPWDPSPIQVDLFESFLANNLVLADADRLGIRYLKHVLRPLGVVNMYTHGEWRELYRRHSDPALSPMRDFDCLWRDVLVRAHNASGRRLIPWLVALSRRAKRFIQRG